MRKKLLAAFMAATMVLSTGVCVSAEEASDPIVIWTFADQHLEYYEMATAKYHEAHPEVEFKIELIPFESLRDKLTVISASEGEECPDLVDVEQGTFPSFMSDDMIFEPLDAYFEKDGVLDKAAKGRLDLYKCNGQYYGVDTGLSPVLMMYREDLFEQYGIEVPTTWEEYKAAAEKFRENDMYIAAQQDVTLGGIALNDIGIFLKAAGKDYVDENGELNITDEFRTLLNDIIEMQKNDQVYVFQTEDETWPAMAEDQVATYLAADWAVGRLADNVPEQSGKWKLAPLPKLTEDSSDISVNGGTGLMMMKYSDKDRDLLWDVLSYLTLDKENLVEKYEMIAMYPIVYDAMAECAGANEYLGGQEQGALYASMADGIPSQYQAPWRSKFSEAFTANAYDLYEENITMDEFCNLLTEAVAE